MIKCKECGFEAKSARGLKSHETRQHKKEKENVIQSPVDPSSQLIVAAELYDDQMIESEMLGEILPHFIYRFRSKNGGPEVVGMTVKGVNEVVRRLNKNSKTGYKITIKPETLRIERDVEYNGVKGVEVSVFGVNLVTAEAAFGLKFEPYTKKSKEGRTYINEFAVEKALSKAERNAKRKLIPETAAVKLIDKLIKENKNNVAQIGPPPKHSEETGTIKSDDALKIGLDKVAKENNTEKLKKMKEDVTKSKLPQRVKFPMLEAINTKLGIKDGKQV